MAPDAKLMAMPVTASGARFEAGTAVALFPTRIAGFGPRVKHQYAVSRDGRFLINQRVDTPITLILNWHLERVGK